MVLDWQHQLSTNFQAVSLKRFCLALSDRFYFTTPPVFKTNTKKDGGVETFMKRVWMVDLNDEITILLCLWIFGPGNDRRIE